jgi:hypothetical protein
MKLILVVKVNIQFIWFYSYQYNHNLDEQGTPYCCGGPIPIDYINQYGGYSDDTYGAAESISKMYDYQ